MNDDLKGLEDQVTKLPAGDNNNINFGRSRGALALNKNPTVDRLPSIGSESCIAETLVDFDSLSGNSDNKLSAPKEYFLAN